ncbi:MAG: MauE/DoxX family redox-associated membrane protein [Acidobacteriota bacterium]
MARRRLPDGVVNRMPGAPEASRPWMCLTLVCRLLLGGVFIYACIDKIQHPDLFAEAVHNYKILPIALENILALTLPWVELGMGAMIIAGVMTRSAALAITFLLAVFTVAIGISLWRGIDITCGCFSLTAHSRRLSWTTLSVDAALLVPCALLLYDPRSALSADAGIARRIERRHR